MTENPADRIVLYTHGYTGLRHHFLRSSIAEDILNHATVPVLMMPLRNEAVAN